MIRVFVTSVLLFICLTTLAQKEQKTQENNIDTAYQAYLMNLKKEAVKKRKILIEEWENAHIDSVHIVHFSKLYFEKVPDISRFTNLKIIEGGNNQIKVLPKSTFISDSLVKIVFSDNEIKRVRFRPSAKITSVNLSNNKLKRIPGSIRKLKQLKYLDLSGNRLKRIPRFLKKLDSLKEITLNYNRIKLKRKSVRYLAHVNNILLAGNNLTVLPENIDELAAARKLNFSINELSGLPASFANLDSLTSVIFYKNQFNEIPPEIFALKKLGELDFYYNKINEIPDEIGDLTNLEQLFLSYNTISKFPESLGRLKGLRYLYLHHNELVIVPEWITHLTSLERLDLSYNRIISLPDLSEMASLSEVDLQENQLGYFPWALLEKENLRILILRNNPFILDENERKFLEKWAADQNPAKVLLVY
ncbi:MAG: leucine-rich repeat domain-containing protein [bacterium]|jgi:Leucine-rich repeat (LRR) protein